MRFTMFGMGILLMLGLMLLFVSGSVAQDVPTVPTLVPPTPLPVADEAGAGDALASESALARVQNTGEVRVGILFNEPPFGELNIRGDVVGYDAALARSIAEAWNVELAFVQVTRQTAVDMLIAGEIDLLIAAQVHRRGLDDRLEFSQTYYRGSQAMMVRLGDAAQSLGDMANRRVGVVMGTAGEDAVNFWQQRSGTTVTVQRYLTIDEAIVALVNGEVDGVVDKRYHLRDLVNPDLTRVLDEAVQPEPYAIAMRRQDINMRNLVNRTLQYLAQNGRMAEIHGEYFPSRPYPEDTVPQWENIGEEAPQPGQYVTDVPYPQQYTVPRVQSSGVLRVAGASNPPDGVSQAEQRLAAVNAQLAERIAGRWGVQVQFVSTGDPVGAVERGEADIALGVTPDWNLTDHIDFAGTYMLRGKRLMVTVQDDFTSFSDLRGKWVGVFDSEPESEQMVRDLAESVNTLSINIFSITREEETAYQMLVENNIDAVFGDSVRLLPHIEANPDTLKLSARCPTCDPWYTRDYVAVAVPRNDINFRLLVDYTLQEMWLDSTLETILSPVTVPGEALTFDVFPGSSDYLGFSLTG